MTTAITITNTIMITIVVVFVAPAGAVAVCPDVAGCLNSSLSPAWPFPGLGGRLPLLLLLLLLLPFCLRTDVLRPR